MPIYNEIVFTYVFGEIGIPENDILDNIEEV